MAYLSWFDALEISIHALCEEGDMAAVRKNDRQTEFLSTPSARRATYIKLVDHDACVISIHALCEEGD